MLSTSPIHNDPIDGRALEAFGQELDVQYILDAMALQRRAELAGRALLVAGVLPPAFAAGVALLSFAKILETMEIGHNVLHGQYDWSNEPALNAAQYEWDWGCLA